MYGSTCQAYLHRCDASADGRGCDVMGDCAGVRVARRWRGLAPRVLASSADQLACNKGLRFIVFNM